MLVGAGEWQQRDYYDCITSEYVIGWDHCLPQSPGGLGSPEDTSAGLPHVFEMIMFLEVLNYHNPSTVIAKLEMCCDF